MAAGVYLLLGPENGQKDEFLDQLREKIGTATGQPPEEYRFYPFSADYTEAVAILRNNAHLNPTETGPLSFKKM